MSPKNITRRLRAVFYDAGQIYHASSVNVEIRLAHYVGLWNCFKKDIHFIIAI
jgi:hypothetical protein